MTHITYGLTAKNRDQLRNPILGNRVWATSTFFTTLTSGFDFQHRVSCWCSLVTMALNAPFCARGIDRGVRVDHTLLNTPLCIMALKWWLWIVGMP